MKKSITTALLIGACAVLITNNTKAQSSSNTNLYAPGRFLGYTNTNGINPLLFQTNATDRMVINGNKTVGINGFGGQVTNGFIGIGPNPAPYGTVPSFFQTNGQSRMEEHAVSFA